MIKDSLSPTEAFRLNARVENYATRTIEIYDYIFDTLQGFLNGTSVEKVDVNTLRQYFVHLEDKGLAPATRSLHYRHLKHFYSFLVQEGYTEKNPLDNIRKPRIPKTLPRVLTNDEIQGLLNACKKTAFTGFRNYVMTLLFLDTGMRLNELINLRLDDADIGNRSVRILGKGDKERTVYLGHKTQRELKKYLKWRFSDDSNNDYVFVSTQEDKLKNRNVQHVYARLSKRAGIKRVAPHQLRHTAATSYIKNGGDGFTLKEILGHASIETTNIYITLAGKDVRKAHLKYSPVDRLF